MIKKKYLQAFRRSDKINKNINKIIININNNNIFVNLAQIQFHFPPFFYFSVFVIGSCDLRRPGSVTAATLASTFAVFLTKLSQK